MVKSIGFFTFSSSLSRPISSTIACKMWCTSTSPVMVNPQVFCKVSFTSCKRIWSDCSAFKSSCKFPAVAAHGVRMFNPSASAIANVRAFRVSCSLRFACLTIPAPQLVAPGKGIRVIPIALAKDSMVTATSGELL